MDQLIAENKDLFDLIAQTLLIVLPIAITWFIRKYVRGTTNERNLATIVNLSNSAIDLVENLDNRGALELSPDASKGLQKLQYAGDWLENELGRAGIKMSSEEAQRWISSEFQKRIGETKMTGKIIELAQTAVALARSLEESGQLELPEDMDRISYLAEWAADWLVANYAKKGATIKRDEALTWVRAQFLQETRAVDSALPAAQQATQPVSELAVLADEAVAYVENKKKSGQLTVRPGSSGGNVEVDIAVARLIYEADERGLNVSSDEIAAAIAAAYERRKA